jgi:hypothetical protein
MDITQWYAVALAAIAALSIVFYVLGISIGFLRTYATYHFLKHVFYLASLPRSWVTRASSPIYEACAES